MISQNSPVNLLESLPSNYVNILYERLNMEFTKSYIQKVVTQKRSNLIIFTKAVELAEENKNTLQNLSNRINNL